ncbi:hypothetical protein D9M69_707380 [compost metagenome]
MGRTRAGIDCYLVSCVGIDRKAVIIGDTGAAVVVLARLQGKGPVLGAPVQGEAEVILHGWGAGEACYLHIVLLDNRS